MFKAVAAIVGHAHRVPTLVVTPTVANSEALCAKLAPALPGAVPLVHLGERDGSAAAAALDAAGCLVLNDSPARLEQARRALEAWRYRRGEEGLPGRFQVRGRAAVARRSRRRRPRRPGAALAESLACRRAPVQPPPPPPLAST